MVYHVSCGPKAIGYTRELPIGEASKSMVYHVSCGPKAIGYTRELPIGEASKSMVYRPPIYTIPEGTANRGGGIYIPNLYHPRGNCQSIPSPRELPIGEGQSIPSPRELPIGEASKSMVYHVSCAHPPVFPWSLYLAALRSLKFHEAYSRLQIELCNTANSEHALPHLL